jgi:hypothetical protein
LTAPLAGVTATILGHELVSMREIEEFVAEGNLGAALDLLRPTVERVLFRLAGLSVSAWFDAGAPDAAELPARRADGSPLPVLAMGHAVALLGFCSARALLVPAEKLALPKTAGLRAVIESLRQAAREADPKHLRTHRFDLVAAAKPGKVSSKGIALQTAFSEFVSLRKLEAHHAGRAQPWVDEHPDYAAVIAPVLWEAFAEITTTGLTPLDGLAVATLDDLSASGRSRGTLATFNVALDGRPRAYHRGPLTGAAAGDVWVVRFGRDPSQVTPVMPFIDLSSGPPRHPRTGEPLG